MARLSALFAVLGAAALVVAAAGNAAAFDLVSRSEWGAKSAITSRMTPQSPREIIIHHTGIKQNPNQTLVKKMRGVQGYGQGDRGWGDLPYHFYIDMYGAVAEGRSLAYAGDTNTSYDVSNRIQIVLEGHFDSDQPADLALSNLSELVTDLRGRYGLPKSAISGHMDHANTDCPGANLYPYLSVLRGGAAAQVPNRNAQRTAFLTAQSALQGLGCYAGSLDGLWGPKSNASLARFNAANGTNLSSGDPQALVTALRAGSARNCF